MDVCDVVSVMLQLIRLDQLVNFCIEKNIFFIHMESNNYKNSLDEKGFNKNSYIKSIYFEPF